MSNFRSLIVGVVVGWFLKWFMDRGRAAQSAETDRLAGEMAVAQAQAGATRSVGEVDLGIAAGAADDLARIEGIGPKIAGLLVDAGIATFAKLALTPTPRLTEILRAGGPQYQIANPASWPEQARLAAVGDWDGLQALQDQLKGGVGRG